MRRIITSLLTTLGLTTACGQANYENADVKAFAEQIEASNVVVLDVRTADEYAEGHIEGAINIDQGTDDFMQKVKATLSTDKTIAVYCRSGRRSANAAGKLADAGYKCVNLKGGITAWSACGQKIVSHAEHAQMPVSTETYEVDVFKTKSGKTVKLHALMHSCIRIEFDAIEIQIDPVGKMGNRTIDYAAMPKADYIFVTHEHGDHYDAAAIRQLTGTNTQLVMNRRCADMYGSGLALANGQHATLGDITIEAVPAYNITEGRTQFHPKGRDNGYILTLDGLRIYIAGDTEDIPEMAAIKDIDIAFLPCNQPYTMTPEQLVRAAKTIKPKVLFPYHYGQTNVSTIPSALKGEGIDVRIRHYE